MKIRLPLSATLLGCLLSLNAYAQNKFNPEFYLDAGIIAASSQSFDDMRLTDGEGQEIEPETPLRAVYRVGMLNRIPAMRAFYGVEAVVGRYKLDDYLDNSQNYTLLTSYSLNAVYRAFPLDIDGDCDCPTWKNDNWFKKALFIEARLGYKYDEKGEDGLVEAQAVDNISYGVGLGVSHRISKGFEIYGVARGSGRYALNSKYEGLSASNDRSNRNTFHLAPALGLIFNP